MALHLPPASPFGSIANVVPRAAAPRGLRGIRAIQVRRRRPTVGQFGFLPGHPANCFQCQLHVLGGELGPVRGHPVGNIFRKVA